MENASQSGPGSTQPTTKPLPPYRIRGLGVAGRIAASFIESPLSPLLLLACLTVGLLALFFTPRQEDPQISVPMVDIFVSYPGASPQQVSALAVEPLERIMSELAGVKHVYSYAKRGGGLVTVRFKVGEDLESSLVKLYDRLESNKDLIPPGVEPPLVKPYAVDDVPVVTLTLWSTAMDDSRLRMLAMDVLQRLKEVPNTSKGFVVGGRKRQIRVEFLPERLAGYRISLEEIAQAIQSGNSESPAGRFERGGANISVSSGSFLRTPKEVEGLMVGIHNGMPVYIRDVAEVTEGPEETARIVEHYLGPARQGGAPTEEGVPGVTVALSKKIGTNGVTVARDILTQLEELKGTIIPDDVQVTVTRNYGQTADRKVDELLSALMDAAIAVSILCLIGLGVRAALVVITVIPVVILFTVWAAWMLGFTIDRVSLFALIFSIGILVDDATVVVENIFRRWYLEDNTDAPTAVDAVREVGNPTILATLAIIAALLPMGFVSGMMGPYMRPIPVLGSVAMLFSLVAAFVFTPWVTRVLKPNREGLLKSEVREQKSKARTSRIYHRLMDPLVRNRALGAGALGVITILFGLACALFYWRDVTVKMLPFDNKPEFNVQIDLPEGTALPVTANTARRLAEALLTLPEVTDLQVYVGTASPFNFNGLVRHSFLRLEPWFADIQVMLTDKDQRRRSSHQIAVAARALLTPLARELGARMAVVEMPPGPPVLQTVVAEVHGRQDEGRRRLAADLTTLFEQTPNVVDVDNYIQAPLARLHFEADEEKTRLRGLNSHVINRHLSMAMGGHVLGDVKREAGVEPVYIVLQAPLHVRSYTNRLLHLPIPVRGGESIPLAELGTFRILPEDPIIFHKDLQPVEYVVGDMEGRLGAPLYAILALEDQLEAYRPPDGGKVTTSWFGPPALNDGLGLEWAGEWTVTYETFRDMGLAFGVALILIYILIVWEFGTFVMPLILMTPIPLTLIGIIPGHWLLGAEFTATSMIGFIALAGIIVRNSILLLDFSITRIAQGDDVQQAVLAAGIIRMRPILITAVTVMAGAGAIIFDPIFQGMAISLLFGTLVATLLTLVVIPLGCIHGRRFLLATAHAAHVNDDTNHSEAFPPPGEAPSTTNPEAVS